MWILKLTFVKKQGIFHNMNEFMKRILSLVDSGDVKISEHGYDQLCEDGLFLYFTFTKDKCWNASTCPLGYSQGVEFSSCAYYCIFTRSRKMDFGFFKEVDMSLRHVKKMIHEGSYVAEVDIDLVESELSWSPYLSLEDAQKMDAVREALKNNDIIKASKLAKVYNLTPVAV